MAECEKKSGMCKSIFQEGNNTTAQRLTAKWIELINRLEKDQARLPAAPAKKK